MEDFGGICYGFNNDEDDYSFHYVLARVQNAFDELTDLSDYLQESDYCKSIGLEKFQSIVPETDKLVEQVEELYGNLIELYHANGLVQYEDEDDDIDVLDDLEDIDE